MDGVLAMASLTLREAVRKRVFVLLLLFAVLLTAGAAFLPVVRPEDQVRVVQSWSLRAMLLFSVLTAVFLAGSSLPGDVESRRIHLLLTKPLTRGGIFFGKYLGFATVLGIGLLLMGGISLAAVVWTARAQGITLEARAWRPASVLEAGPGARAGDLDGVPGVALDGPEPPGGERPAAVFRFRGLDRNDYEEHAPAVVKAEIAQGENVYRGRVEIFFPDRPPDPARAPLVLSIRNREPVEFTFPREAITSDGDLRIALRRASGPGAGSTRVLVRAGDAEISPRPAPYALVWFTGLALLYAELLILLSATTAVSTFVSGGVAAFFGITIFLFGSIYGFMEESLKASRLAVGTTAARGATPVTRRRSDSELPMWLIDYTSRAGAVAIRGIPDFRTYDFTRLLLKDRAVDGPRLAAAWGSAAPYILLPLVAGWVVLRRRQYG